VPFSRWVDINTKHDEIFAKESHEARMSNEANLRALHLANNEQLLALRQKKDEIKSSDLPTPEKNKQLADIGTQLEQISDDNNAIVNKLRVGQGLAPVKYNPIRPTAQTAGPTAAQRADAVWQTAGGFSPALEATRDRVKQGVITPEEGNAIAEELRKKASADTAANRDFLKALPSVVFK
jgi:hypothetical protein